MGILIHLTAKEQGNLCGLSALAVITEIPLNWYMTGYDKTIPLNILLNFLLPIPNYLQSNPHVPVVT